MDKTPAPAKADKKNEKLTGWLGAFVGLTSLGAAWTVINLFRNNFDMLGECGKSSILLKAFCKDITPPLIAEIVVGFIFVALAILAVVLVSKRKKIAIPYVIAFESAVLAWNIVDFAIANAVLGPWAAKTNVNITGTLVVSLVISVIQAGIWIPYFILSKKAKQELDQ